MSEIYIQQIKSKVVSAFIASKEAHTEIFKLKSRSEIAISQLLLSSSIINSAHAIYICQYERLGRDDLDELFIEFESFINEAMGNFRYNHSHQWSDIHFKRLEDKYKAAASNLGITQ